MKNTGQDMINAICKRLDEEGLKCHDTAIVNKLRSLDFYQLNELFHHGDVVEWHNDRINRG